MTTTTKRCTTSITSAAPLRSRRGAGQQQRDIGESYPSDGDGDDAPRPYLDIGGGFGANAKQAERPGQRPHDADQRARQRIGIDDREDHKPGGCEIADPGAQQHRGDPDEDEHREQLKRETSEHEGQPDQRLPGARQAETPPMQRGRRGNVSRRRWRIGYRQRLHRGTRRLRKPRFQQRHRPLDEAEHQPLGSKSADEHQRQLPGDIEQLMIGDGSLAVRTNQ